MALAPPVGAEPGVLVVAVLPLVALDLDAVLIVELAPDLVAEAAVVDETSRAVTEASVAEVLLTDVLEADSVDEAAADEAALLLTATTLVL